MPGKRQKNRKNSQIDLDVAREITEAFSDSTGVSCRLCDTDGQDLIVCRKEDACIMLSEAVNHNFNCEEKHQIAARDAERFGGRYIYSCPMGMTFVAASILSKGKYCGALIGGPVRIMDSEDQLAGAAITADDLDDASTADALSAIVQAPLRTPKQLKDLSMQLFANAVFISDSGQEMIALSKEYSRRSSFDEYISRLTEADGAPVPYPLEKERQMVQAITRGDGDSARHLLNDILGHVFFYTGDIAKVHTRVTELLVVITRAIADSGRDIDPVLNLSHRLLHDLRSKRSQEELTRWVADSMTSLMELVDTSDTVRHSEAVQQAINYIRSHYALGISLAEVAEFVGYSPTYFSRIFKDETGSTFKEYLNALRVERSKTLLLTSDIPLADVGSMAGFNGQSYFCKIFKQATGVSPDKYRKRIRRIDPEREYGYKN